MSLSAAKDEEQKHCLLSALLAWEGDLLSAFCYLGREACSGPS